MAKTVTVIATYLEGTRFDVRGDPSKQVMLESSLHAEPSDRFSPMEMVLVALAGCLGMSVMPVLRKMRQEVTGYEIRVSGTQSESYPRVYTQIAVEHLFTGRNLKHDALARAVKLAEEGYCGVSAMLGKAATITHTITLREAPEVVG